MSTGLTQRAIDSIGTRADTQEKPYLVWPPASAADILTRVRWNTLSGMKTSGAAAMARLLSNSRVERGHFLG
jgi:hypothetical protein